MIPDQGAAPADGGWAALAAQVLTQQGIAQGEETEAAYGQDAQFGCRPRRGLDLGGRRGLVAVHADDFRKRRKVDGWSGRTSAV
nr:hypothetical protein KitaXyl93_10830 [Kitasatospora sp. Xyl93]